MDKVKLLKDICEFYDFELHIADKVRYYSLNVLEYQNPDDFDFTFDTVDEALKGWLLTLMLTDECNLKDNVPMTWEDEIEFIQSL